MDKKNEREVHIELGGETRRVLLCLKSLLMAQKQGYDVSSISILNQPEDGDEEGDEDDDVGPNFEHWVDILWLGRLPFEPNLSREDVALQCTMGEMLNAREKIEEAQRIQITDSLAEAADKMGGGDDEGKS